MPPLPQGPARNAMSLTSSDLKTPMLLVTLVVLLALPMAVASDENPFRLKPGARGPNCLECHVTFQETMALPYVHSPVAAGNCSDCHDPHSSSHSKLLAEDVSQICVQCHEKTVPADAKSVHEAILGGNCVSCHDPHAADNPNNLLVAGNDLCATCHDGIAEAAQSSRFKHSPVVDSCLNCHDPHASTEAEFLLTSAVPALCKTCHDTATKGFIDQHMGYPVGDANCTSCHDPHGSDNGAILWANVHAPIANKMCSQCHNDASAPDALQTKKEKIDLCRGCHSRAVNETLNMSRLHGPVVSGKACLNCHSPHASPQDNLLTDSMVPLCGSCHESTIRRQETSFTKHDPIASGECTLCHSPHSSNTEFLLSGDNVIEVCGACHDWESHSTHPIGPDVRDPRNESLSVGCLSCHRTHGSAYGSFTHYEPKRELCVECHQDYRR